MWIERMKSDEMKSDQARNNVKLIANSQLQAIIR